MKSDTGLVAAFSGADLTDLPPISSIGDERGQILWVLHVANARLGTPIMTPGEISAVLRDAYGIKLSWQKIEAVLSKENDTVARRRRDRRPAYQIMQAGVDVLVSASQIALFIDPTQALTKMRQVEGILADLKGVVRLCDPYIDKKTLDLVAECTGASELRLLTANIDKPGPFKRDLQLFRQEHGVSIEVRQVTGRMIHDRYAIHDDGMLLFGASLNYIGRKQSFIVALGEDLRTSVLPAFDVLWAGANVV